MDSSGSVFVVLSPENCCCCCCLSSIVVFGCASGVDDNDGDVIAPGVVVVFTRFVVCLAGVGCIIVNLPLVLAYSRNHNLKRSSFSYAEIVIIISPLCSNILEHEMYFINEMSIQSIYPIGLLHGSCCYCGFPNYYFCGRGSGRENWARDRERER